MIIKKRGQIWIETVLYTLIGLVLIAIILGFVSPKISSLRDRILIEQTMESLQIIDSKIQQVSSAGSGNIGIVPILNIKRGILIINSTSDQIKFVISDLNSLYSESDTNIKYGNINILSSGNEKESNITLTLNYETNIIYEGRDDSLGYRIFYPASTPYSISIENVNNTYLNIKEESQ